MPEARILMTPELVRLWRIPLYRAGHDVRECGASEDAILAAVSREEPDILLLNAMVFSLDAARAARVIRAMPLTCAPAVIALFPGAAEEAMRRAAGEGIICLSGVEITADEILRLCGEMTVEDRLLPDFARPERVEAMLRALSISERAAGFRYLAAAVSLCARDQNCFFRLSRLVYPAVGRRYGARPAAVERLIRHAIESAWLRGDMERQYALFGNTVDERRGKPTNSEFIARVTEALRLEANL